MSLAMTLAVLAVAGGAAAQAITGLGFALVCAPFVIAVLGPRDGVVVVVLLSLLASVLPLAREGGRTRWRPVVLLFVPTALATPVIAWGLQGVSTRLLAVASGLAILVGVALLWRGSRVDHLTGTAGAVVTGVASAAMNVVGGVGGPPVALYASNAGWPVPASRATMLTFGALQSVVTVAVLGWATPTWPLLAALVVGTVVGTWLAVRVPHGATRVGVLVVAALGGVLLVGGWGS